jgi:hypothetical protein
MALCTPNDEPTLRTWNVLRDYNRNRVAFIAFGKACYRALLNHGGATVAVPSALERPLQATLEVQTLFKAICATKRHATPNMNQVWALALSRYMLDNEWTTLIAP